MTGEEKQLINTCRIMIVGADNFIDYIQEELRKLGFNEILNIEPFKDLEKGENRGILIEYIGDRSSQTVDVTEIPVIYPFDFIAGAGAIVLFPADDRKWLDNNNVRVWAADYMAGYCAFWKIPGCEWLHDALLGIKRGETSKAATKTAAYLCAKIAANIATGREVKHFPRFYLAESI